MKLTLPYPVCKLYEEDKNDEDINYITEKEDGSFIDMLDKITKGIKHKKIHGSGCQDNHYKCLSKM